MRALVIGGGTGLGRAAALAIARGGARVFLSGRRTNVLAAVAEELAGASAGFTAGDATAEADVARVVTDAVAAMGGIDSLVVSAGASAVGSVVDATLADVRRILDTNILPLFLFARQILPYMPAEGGSIIAVASIAGSVPHPERLAYCTSKAGVIGMVRQMAFDLAPRGIRVNAVSPSLVLTELARGALRQAPDPEAMLAYRVGRHPLGRLGTEEEVGTAIAYLASDAASWITGQDFQMDGGLALAAMHAAAKP